MKTDAEIFNAPFDIETHKEHFIDYLEVVITKEGEVLYATPSHEKVVLSILYKQGFTGRDLYNHSSIDLALLANAVLIWNKGYDGVPNQKQKEIMRKLKDAGIYRGEIEPPPIEEILKNIRNNFPKGVDNEPYKNICV